MGPEQGELGHRVVIEIDFLPVAFGMAARAIFAVAAFVGIVLGMASIAGQRRAGLAWRLDMAAFARRLPMRAAQGKFGHRIVIEPDLRPDPGGVAVLAFDAIGTVVGIVSRMTGIAPARGMAFGIAGPVAGFTSRRGVSARQGKSGAIVIEGNGRPAGGTMARSAIRAPGAAVAIVLPVAIDALCSSPLPHLSLVA